MDYDSDDNEELSVKSEPAFTSKIHNSQLKMKYVGHRNAR